MSVVAGMNAAAVLLGDGLEASAAIFLSVAIGALAVFFLWVVWLAPWAAGGGCCELVVGRGNAATLVMRSARVCPVTGALPALRFVASGNVG